MIIFTSHALLKLKQRGISKIAVRKTLNSPDYKIPGYSNRKIAYKKFDKFILKSDIQDREGKYRGNYSILGKKTKIN